MSTENKKNNAKLVRAFNTLQKAFKEAGESDPELIQAMDLVRAAISNLPQPQLELEFAAEEDSAGAGAGESLPRPEIEPGEVAVYSDGACRGNPGPGSWAFVAQDSSGEVLQKASGVSSLTTNNKMELQGVIEGLTYLLELGKPLPAVHFHTDSKYVVDGITKWVPGWKARGWKKADKKEPENLEQWKLLDQLAAKFNVKFIWVKGHAGHPQNEMCDRLANEALDAQGY